MKRFDSFVPGERYQYDFGMCSYPNGFAQLDTEQDASYYGNWINPVERKAVCFAEGDLTVVEFDDDAEMIAWVQRFKDHEDLGFKGIDPGLGEVMRSQLIAHGLGPFLH